MSSVWMTERVCVGTWAGSLPYRGAWNTQLRMLPVVRYMPRGMRL